MVIQCWHFNLKNLLMKVLVDIGRTEGNALRFFYLSVIKFDYF